MVEAALAAPLMMLVLLLIIEAGRMMYLSIALQHAAMEGAAYGATVTADSDFTGMKAAASDDIDASGLVNELYPKNNFAATASSFCECADGSSTSCTDDTCTTGPEVVFVQVDTSATYSTLVSYLSLPGSFTMTGQAILRVQ